MISKEPLQLNKSAEVIVPEGWAVNKIGDSCKLVKKQFLPSKDDVRPYIGLEHIEQQSLRLLSIGSSKNVESNKFEFKSGQILFGKLRPYFRKVYQPKFDGVCSTDIWVIDVKESNDRIFFFYFFADKRIVDKANNSSEGTRMPRAKWDYLEKLEYPLPFLLEQRAIGKFLSGLDAKIELNQQMNRTLEAIGQAVFKRWFVDFEFPNEEGKPYKSSGGKMIDSEIGEIPKDWLVLSNISEICEKVDYGYTQSASTEEVGPRFLRVMDINKGDWIDWNTVPFCEIDKKDTPKYILNKKDIVIARMADPGKIAIFEADRPAVFASYLIRIRLTNPSIAYYLYYLMKSAYYQNYIEGASTGSVQKNLNAKALTTGLPIAIPSKEVVFLFNSIVENLRAKINSNLIESNILSKIRDALLPKLMSGKIRVPIDNEMERQ